MKKDEVIYRLKKIMQICMESNDDFENQLDRIYDEVDNWLFEMEIEEDEQD